MTDFARIAVRSPQPFDIVGDTFSLCGLGTSFEGVIGSAVLYDKHRSGALPPGTHARAEQRAWFHALRLHRVCR